MQVLTVTAGISSKFTGIIKYFMFNPFIKKFTTLLDLGSRETRILEGLQKTRRSFPARHRVYSAEEPLRSTYIIDQGWIAKYKLLEDGRQQIINYALPGDMLGIDAMVLEKPEHSTMTITGSTLWQVDPERLLDLFHESPRLATAICWCGTRESAIMGEHIVRIGRCNALESIAHLILELHSRLEMLGLVSGNEFEFPLTQDLIADTLGLTTVHVNRTLRKMSGNGLIKYSDSRMLIPDYGRLRLIAGFDPAYLEPDTKPPVTRRYADQIR